ncbi:cell wall protein RBR3 [Fagus crenata]
MNRTFSSKIPKKPSPAPSKIDGTTEKTKKKKKKKQQSPTRNPLQDFNAISTSSSTSHSSEASSVSTEAPRGCLRFFLSQHSNSTSNSRTPFDRNKTLSKTPRSAPNVMVSKLSKSKPSRENKLSKSNIGENSDRPISQKAQKFKKNPPCLYQWQSGKKPSSKTGRKLKISSVLNNGDDSVNKLASGSEGEGLVRVDSHVGEATELKQCGADATCTPLSKIASGSGLDCEVGKVVQENSNKSNTKTPPVQASVSPELQCGSSVVSTAITPACYAAGAMVSGVTDKRKCRPRGILTIGENDDFGKVKPFDSFDDDDEEENVIGVGDDSIVIPEPAEASMHWILSPCNEEDEDQKENSENGLCGVGRLVGSDILHSPSSPSSGDGFSLDVGNNGNTKSTTNSSRRRTTLISPNGLPEFEGFMEPLCDREAILSSPCVTPSCEAITLKEGGKNLNDLEGENFPFSLDSFSGNVMRTPQSDSSSGRLVGLSWLNEDSYKKHHFESELNSVADILHMPSLSPKSHLSTEDPVDSSFQFDCLTTTSNSIDLTHFQKVLDDRASWLSNSTFDNVSQSQMRISWREGLVSRIYEMDEFDCCRCLSDEEEDASGCNGDRLKSHWSPEANVDVGSNQKLASNAMSTEFVDNEPGTNGKGKEQFPSQLRCSCVESISTDGGGLDASKDSDWSLCYKNHLFEV